MRVLVMYEDDGERGYAENLAKVLVQLGPSLAANAVISDTGGGVTMRLDSAARAVPNVLVRTADYRNEFDQLMAVTLGMER